ncbi:MAG: hypothetical protein KDA52_16450 [Planctomycetaceae bacterium]|nr:hypothetical protein [Planctomycetaceae bacterium]
MGTGQQSLQSPSLSDSTSSAKGKPSNETKPPVEVGLVIAGVLDTIDREAIEAARRRLMVELESRFADFRWTLSSVSRTEIDIARRVDPVVFLDDGQMERDLHQWDFVLIITSADLIGHHKPFALGVVSRTIDLAVISTARIDPNAVELSADDESRIERIAERLQVLVLRCLGHLNGLPKSLDPNNLMWDFDNVIELDSMTEWTADQLNAMTSNLRAIADLRLEERMRVNTRSKFGFYARVAWSERREILNGILEAEPWLFPLRLSRLTTAAVSTMLVLMMTSETWDMAMSQSISIVLGMVLVSMCGTTAYVVARQQLLVRRQDRLLSEQIAVSKITTTLTVTCGLATSLLTLFIVSLILSYTLFAQPVVEKWGLSVQNEILFSHYVRLCGVIAAFSLCIGALGATFEDQSYFRHVTFVDEEL